MNQFSFALHPTRRQQIITLLEGLPTKLSYAVTGLLRCPTQKIGTDNREVMSGTCLEVRSGIFLLDQLVQTEEKSSDRKIEALSKFISGEFAPEKISFGGIQSYSNSVVAMVAIRLAKYFFLAGYDGTFRVAYGYIDDESFAEIARVDLYFGSHIEEDRPHYELHIEYEDEYKSHFEHLLSICERERLHTLQKA